MGKKKFAMLIVAVVAMFAGYNVYQSQNTVVLSELALANVEALANREGGFGCVKGAYEWDDDWHEDTKKFMVCRTGCPETEGTKPQYVDCR